MTRLLTALAFVAFLGLFLAICNARTATAQTTDCPKNTVCVEYAGSIVEIDPTLGFYQSIVVEERTVTIRTLNDTTIQRWVKVASFASDGDAYVLAREDTVERTGVFANADLGDVFILQEAG